MTMISKGELLATPQLQPGWTVNYEDDGTVTGSCTFVVDESALVASLPKKGTAHPRNSYLKAYRSRGTSGEAGVSSFTVDYLGLTKDPSEPRLSFQGSLSQEPIETHPDFKTEIGGTPGAPKNGAKFDDDGSFLGFPSNDESVEAKLVGVTGYLRPGAVVRVTYFTAKPANFRFDHTGQIATSVPGLPKDIRLPEGANWLIGSPALEPFGPFNKISVDYLLSGPGGWNGKIYKSIPTQ